MDIFFPSCNFTKASPKTAKMIRDYFKERMSVAGCCLYDKKEYTSNDTALVLCQACRGQLESKINTKIFQENYGINFSQKQNPQFNTVGFVI